VNELLSFGDGIDEFAKVKIGISKHSPPRVPSRFDKNDSFQKHHFWPRLPLSPSQ